MKRKNHGFTILELLVVLLIMGVLFVSINSFIRAGAGQYKNINSRVESQKNARLVMAFVSGEIRRNDASGRIEVIQNHDFFSDGTKLINLLKVKRSENDFIWIFQRPDDYKVYYKETISETFDPDTAVQITTIPINENGFILEKSNGLITLELKYSTGNLKVSYALRSDPLNN